MCVLKILTDLCAIKQKSKNKKQVLQVFFTMF